MVDMLMALTGKERKEVWCQMTEIANLCAKRLNNSKKQQQRHSWTRKIFPGTDIGLRIDMHKNKIWQTEKWVYRCEVKYDSCKYESFTQQQVNEYITENIILGDDE